MKLHFLYEKYSTLHVADSRLEMFPSLKKGPFSANWHADMLHCINKHTHKVSTNHTMSATYDSKTEFWLRAMYNMGSQQELCVRTYSSHKTVSKTSEWKYKSAFNLTILFCLGQLHKLLLFQSVHHVCQTSFATLWSPKCEANDWFASISGTFLWFRWRGRVSPVGVDWAALGAFIVLRRNGTTRVQFRTPNLHCPLYNSGPKLRGALRGMRRKCEIVQ